MLKSYLLMKATSILHHLTSDLTAIYDFV